MEVTKDARLYLVAGVCLEASFALKEYALRHMDHNSRYCQECHLWLTNTLREVMEVSQRGHVRDELGKIMHVEVKDVEGP